MNEASEQSKHNWFIRWKHTLVGRLVWAVLDLAIAYLFASLAINSGAIWQWGVAVLFTIDGVYNIIRLVVGLIRGRGRAA